MSETINHGGPAFPVPNEHYPNGEIQYGCNGMSLRQWYAGQALAGLLASYAGINAPFRLDLDVARAFQAADAMIAHEAQERGGGQ